MGERVIWKSLGISLTSGVSTAPGATALKRMLFFAYSLARLIVIAFNPPLVSIEIDAGRPAIGFSASEAVMLVTLPPVPCDSICVAASWVIKKKPSRLVETRLRKSSTVWSVKGLTKKTPALLTRASIGPNLLIAVCAMFEAVAA